MSNALMSTFGNRAEQSIEPEDKTKASVSAKTAWCPRKKPKFNVGGGYHPRAPRRKGLGTTDGTQLNDYGEQTFA
jgi:hypothetical protein